MAFKIGSFNLRNIGPTALSSKSPRSIEKIAQIIRDEEFDIVALQEVSCEGKALGSKSYAKKSLLMELGPDWDFRWANAEADGSGAMSEGYAFIWNIRRMRLVTTVLDNGTVRTFNPRICQIKHGNMFRKPYYARFTPDGTFASLPIEFRLLCIHTYHGQQDSPADRIIRSRELNTLLTEIYPKVADLVYRTNYPSYTIVLGDYNAELYRTWHETLARGKKPMYIDDIVLAKRWDNIAVRTVQDQLTTLKSGGTESDSGENPLIQAEKYLHNYDHFSFEDSDRYLDLGLSWERIDAVCKYTGGDAERYRQEISDHLPIILSIEI